ncbi:MAG TPA: aminotransferase class I/II-fold pyridoxal phosphate-dependent enzyme [Chitinophaga sp.]|uniref:pyridoxal phosphate-dependent aminotransferase n=1 Tax=Chitinophaga sp. TaxID=1869181 RepID=UPI002B568B8E|nr:aminotransferase class I/II-fold pyridoxal phosphate-dependent enzyme [Chitinophaga sp.]HVI43959.1 aminotransferase class I/II-fold pyridoxal phosphate-dependent enzyme [Chitinophaga sp.]
MRHYLLTLMIGIMATMTVTAQQPSDTIRLSLNENPFPPSVQVLTVIQQAFPNVPRYNTAVETGALTAAIAAREGVSPDQIVIGEILDQLGLYLGIKAGRGGEFIYSVPGYPLLVDAAAATGGQVIPVPLTSTKENDLNAILQKINHKTKVIYIINPHNPSGTVSDNAAFHRFLHEASQKALVIIDEAYLEYAGNFTQRTAVNDLKRGDNILVFRTLAKAYGLAGLSIGYAVMQAPLAAWLKSKGLGSPLSLNRLSVAAATAALKDTTAITSLQQTIAAERNKWHHLLDSLHLEHTASNANYIFFNTKKDYTQVEAAFRSSKILIGRMFAPYNTWIRITIGTPQENEKAQAVVKRL